MDRMIPPTKDIEAKIKANDEERKMLLRLLRIAKDMDAKEAEKKEDA